MDDLQESGVLTDKDIKNIDEYMDKERTKKNAEMKEEIYKSECERIDTMVSQKVITKEKGNKLKSAVIKENLDEFEEEMNSRIKENQKIIKLNSILKDLVIEFHHQVFMYIRVRSEILSNGQSRWRHERSESLF